MLLFCLLIICMIGMHSCKKGSPGDQGPQGQQGEQGPQGEKGEEGLKNIFYSSWRSLVRVKDSTIDVTKYRIGHIYHPVLKPEFQDKSIIKVYMTYDNGNTVFSLPHTSFAGGKLSTINYFFKSTTREIVVTRYTHDNSNSVTLGNAVRYRFVAFPGNLFVSKLKDLDLNNYDEVIKIFTIK